MSSGFTFRSIGDTVGKVTANREVALQTTLKELGDSPSTFDMLKVQQEMQQWSMFTQIQSTVIKELSDALKGVIQKAA